MVSDIEVAYALIMANQRISFKYYFTTSSAAPAEADLLRYV